MKPKIVTAIETVDRFIRDVHPDDEIFYMTFGDAVHLRQDFTGDRGKLSRALQTVALSYGTALFDGVLSGLDKVRKGKHPKKALLLISDGIDSVSQRDFKVASAGVRESKAAIYALGIAPDDPNDATLDMDSLNSFAEESGGKVWLIQRDNRSGALEAALGQVADELRSQYSVGYYPGHSLSDGKWHRVEIRLKNPEYTIRYKQDYFGG
jgi:Ca-activated chloride channel family protein